jgi:hypothetical protein
MEVLDLFHFLGSGDAETCVESRYLLCQLPLDPVSSPAIGPGSNPVLACVESRGSD